MSGRKRGLKRQQLHQESKLLRRSKRRLMEGQEGPSGGESEAAASGPSTKDPDNGTKTNRLAEKRQSSGLPGGDGDKSPEFISGSAYKAQPEDELSFEKDDVITLLSSGDVDRLKGRCKGREGYFPRELLQKAKASNLARSSAKGREYSCEQRSKELQSGRNGYFTESNNPFIQSLIACMYLRVIKEFSIGWLQYKPKTKW
eukprot:m.254266 g.254266  ORF g.254266 m.254266 type:complete len:201 (+) comp40382_c1_seq12:130-732(+)